MAFSRGRGLRADHRRRGPSSWWPCCSSASAPRGEAGPRRYRIGGMVDRRRPRQHRRPIVPGRGLGPRVRHRLHRSAVVADLQRGRHGDHDRRRPARARDGVRRFVRARPTAGPVGIWPVGDLARPNPCRRVLNRRVLGRPIQGHDRRGSSRPRSPANGSTGWCRSRRRGQPGGGAARLIDGGFVRLDGATAAGRARSGYTRGRGEARRGRHVGHLERCSRVLIPSVTVVSVVHADGASARGGQAGRPRRPPRPPATTGDAGERPARPLPGARPGRTAGATWRRCPPSRRRDGPAFCWWPARQPAYEALCRTARVSTK